MDIAELLKTLGVELSEEQVAMIKEAVTGETENLVKNRDDILKEKHTLSETLKAAQVAEAAAKEAAIKSSGDMEELKKFYATEADKRVTDEKERGDRLQDVSNERDRLSVNNDFLGVFTEESRAVGELYLEKYVKIEDGQRKYVDYEGNVIADSADKYKEYLKGNDSLKSIILGSQASGGSSDPASSPGGETDLKRPKDKPIGGMNAADGVAHLRATNKDL